LRIYNVENLSVVQERRQNEAMIPVSLGTLGQQLVQEKLDHSQTKQLVSTLGQQLVQEKLKNTQLFSTLGQELVQAKLEIATLKGGNA
jgi:hypothetical protein